MVIQLSFFINSSIISRKKLFKLFNPFFSILICQKIRIKYLLLLFPRRHPLKVHDYWSISLCNTFYKIITKILINRLQPLLPSMISLEQGTFVQGRSIAKNILLSQEVMQSFHKASSTRGLAMIKVDMKKAYDRVHWDFLFHILNQFGFHPIFLS